MFLNKLKLNIETVNAIWIIILNTFLIAAGFVTGFVWQLFLVVAVFSFLISFRYPRSGIYAIVFLTLIFEMFFSLSPIKIGSNEYKIYFLDIILLAVFVSYFFQIIFILANKKNTVHLKENKYLIFFFVLIFVHFLADVLNGADKNLAFSSFKHYIFYPWLYFAIIFFFNKKEDFLRLLKFYFIGTIVIIFFIFWGSITGKGLWTEYTPLSTEGIRILDFGHAFYLLMAVLSVVVLSLYRKNKNRLWLDIVLFIWIVGILGSMMRHLWIGFFLSLIFLYFLIDKEKKKIFFQKISKAGVYLLGGIFLILFLFLLSPHYSNFNKAISESVQAVQIRTVSIFSNTDNDESFSWRGLVWRESAKEYLKNPIWGVGFGKKIYVESIDYKDFVELRNIHNSWLVLFFQSGLLVSLFFIIFLAKTFWKLIRIKNKSWGAVIVAVLLFNYFIVSIFQPYWETNMLAIFFWILLGLAGIINYNYYKYENIGNK